MAKRVIKKDFTKTILVEPEDHIIIKKGVVGQVENSGFNADNRNGPGSMDGALLKIDGTIKVSKQGPISSAIWSDTNGVADLTIDIGKTGVLKAGLYGIHHGGPGLIVDNAGLIQGNVGIGGEMKDADITNSGRIVGVATGIDWSQGLGGELVNSGLIRATKGAAIEIGQFLGAESYSIRNSGTLETGVKSGSAIAVTAETEMLSIVNTGKIKGNVELGYGAAEFENRGTVTGTVTGSLGDTEYRLVTKTKLGVDLGGYDTVHAYYSIRLVEGIEDLVLRGNKDLSGTGNADNNIITGNSGDNILKGLLGVDRLSGGRGDDRLYGGDQSDTFVYATGFDRDIIEDADETDFIDLTGVSVATSLEALLGRADYKNGNVVVDFGSGDTLTFRDMTIKEFADLQFLYHGAPE